jgi:hypothetical protein
MGVENDWTDTFRNQAIAFKFTQLKNFRNTRRAKQWLRA